MLIATGIVSTFISLWLTMKDTMGKKVASSFCLSVILFFVGGIFLMSHIFSVDSVGGPTVILKAPFYGGFETSICNGSKCVDGLIDSGATVSHIKKSDVRRLNLELTEIVSKNVEFHTANGKIYANIYRVKQLVIGNIVCYDVLVSVVDGDGPTKNLIGLSVLTNKFEQVIIKGNRITLYGKRKK